jgi:Tol biopolymer transport system component
MEADGSNQVNLTNNPAIDMQPVWSPDGSRVVFASTRDRDNFELYVMGADGTAPTRITHSEGTGFGPAGPDWSPDGNRIAFWNVADGDETGQIYVMNVDGSEIMQLTDIEGPWKFDPVWSPNGNQIAFLGGSGAGVFIMDADGSNLVQINEGGGWPDWSPDGSQITYPCPPAGGWNEIYVSNADGTGEVNLTNHPADDTWGSWRPAVGE